MKKNKIIIFCNLLILLAVTCSGLCADANSLPNPAGIQAQTTAPGALSPQIQPLSPAPVQAPDNSYSYNPLGKPDPFKPFIDVEIAEIKKAKASKVESIFPLQRAAVESFRLVGIVGDQVRRVAVVEDTSRKFYPIFVGTRIGLNDGKVTDILADRITVDEFEGKKIKRVILKLRKNF